MFIKTILFFVVFGIKTGNGQEINYIKLSNSYIHHGCGNNHIDSINASYKQLKTIDTNKIAKGKYEYFYDLGMACYGKGLREKDSAIIQESIYCFKRCIQLDKYRSFAYENLLILYWSGKDKKQALDFLHSYKKYVKKKKWDLELIKSVEAL